MAQKRPSKAFLAKATKKARREAAAAAKGRGPGRPRKDAGSSGKKAAATKAKGKVSEAELVRRLSKMRREGGRVTSPLPRTAIARALKTTPRKVREALGVPAKVVVGKFRIAAQKRRRRFVVDRFMELARLGLRV